MDQSPSTDLSAPGAKTVTLAACPPGVVGSELFYYVYIAGTGTPDAGDVAESKGVNIVLDQQLIADIKALIVAIEEYAKTAGLQKPVAGK